MKKFYLLAVAAIAALSMSAQTIYVKGSGTLTNGTNLGWDEGVAGYAVNPGSDGSYTMNFSSLTGFKMSLAPCTTWDDYNAQAFGFNGTFGDAVFSTAGQVVTLQAWGENQDMPYTGAYTVTVNSSRTQMTVKANFSKPTTATPVYFRGYMNGWGSGSQWQFSYDYSREVYYIDNVTIAAGSGNDWKIADANWGSINYGGQTNIEPTIGSSVTLSYNSSTNCYLQTAYTGRVEFKLNGNNTATLSFVDPSGEEPEPTYPETMYVIGTINGDAWNPTNVAEMTNEGDGFYTIENITLGEFGGSCGFALTEAKGANDNDWNTVNNNRYGPADKDRLAVVGENPVDGYGDTSWSIAPGTYNMYFDYTEKTLEIEQVGGPVGPSKLYMQWCVEGMMWTLGHAIYSEGVDGVYTYTGVEIPQIEDDGYGYFSFSTQDAEDWNDLGTRYGATTPDTKLVLDINATSGSVMGTAPLALSQDAFMIYGDSYDFEVDLNNSTVKIIKNALTTGVEDIAVEGANAAAVYFNLQGVRVVNPTAGQLLIKKEGSNVSKVLVK